MDRGTAAHPLSWFLLPVAGALIASALSLPGQPYTGLVLREDLVIRVVPGGPGERAGLRAGDRISTPDPGRPVWRWGQPVTAFAAPGMPLPLERRRDGVARSAWMVPDPLPDGERRMMAVLLLVASGFVLLGGWVWSERRDRLTGPFYLLSLAFAGMLAPVPRFPWPALGALHELLYAGLTLLLPALFVHFFALFPEPRAPRGRMAAGVAAAYGVAALLSAGWFVAFALRALAHPALEPVLVVLQGASALWFATGLLTALGLFARSYRRAGTPDARRRLRVALAGTAIGLAPLAALIVAHNLAPAVAVPGERWAVVLTLLVPASFAWAVAVHGIFDFAVALRASVAALSLTLIAGAAWLAGEWLAATWWPERSAGVSGAALALVALGAALAGPSRPWARALGARLLALEDPPALAAALAPANGEHRDGSAAGLLARACEALVSALKLDGCAALWVTDDGLLLSAASGRPLAPLEPGTALAEALTGRAGPLAADHHAMPPAERSALEAAGVSWVLPVGDRRPAAVLLLGRRLAGPWLGAREAEELERMAGHLAVALENLALRGAARSLGDRDRELERAGAIQSHLLPRRAPVFPTLDCAAATLSSEPVGGDYYDFVQRSEREFTLVVGDAAGHGVPAALVLAGVQARFRAEAGGGRDPSEVLRALNQELVGLGQPAKFVGLLCARVDVRHGRIWLANAGLTPPLLRRRGGRCEELTAGGMLLGVSDQARYRDVCVELRAGDLAVFYTDGLTEARAGEEMFGLERVCEVLDRHAHERAARILAALVAGVRAFVDRPLDDLTVLVLKQLADPLPAVSEAGEIPLKSTRRPAENRG
jgi:sigma-B regulation protein RsbU (phosphoserine phosphatase)